MEISDIFITIESKEEGPFSFELQSIDLLYNEDYAVEFEKYHLPIFLKVWKFYLNFY